MTPAKLAVSDKVVLHEHWLPCETHMRPRPVRGVVYCVRMVEEDPEGRQYVRLVGLRSLPRRLKGQEVSFTAHAFRRVGATVSNPRGEEGGQQP